MSNIRNVMTYVRAAPFVTVTTFAKSCEMRAHLRSDSTCERRAQLRSDSTCERPTDWLHGISYYVGTNEPTFRFRVCLCPFYFVPKNLKRPSALPRHRSLVRRSPAQPSSLPGIATLLHRLVALRSCRSKGTDRDSDRQRLGIGIDKSTRVYWSHR